MKLARNPSAQLDMFVASAPLAMAMFDSEMRYIAVSQRWLTDHGLAASPVGRMLYEVFPEISEVWKGVHRRCLAGASETSDGEPFLRADGRVHWVKWTACPWRDAEGHIGGIVLTSEDIATHKEVEAEAAYLASVVTHSTDAIIAKTLDSVVSAWNPGATKLLGYSAEEMIGRSIARVIPPERLGEEEQILERLLAGEEIAHFETKRVAKDGRVLDVSLSISPIRDAFGKIVGASKIMRDVTEQIRVQRELASTAAILAAEHESSPDGILAFDPKGQILALNRRLAEISGIPYESLAASDESVLRAMALQQVTDVETFTRRMKYLYDHPEEWGRDELLLQDGRVIDRLTSPLKSAAGETLGRIWFFRDVTKLRKAEDSLRDSEERFRLLVEEAPDAILLYDFDQKRQIAANKAAERLFGASRDELLEHEPLHFLAPEQLDGRPASESFLEHCERALAGEEVNVERRVRLPSGKERICRAALVRLPSDGRLLRGSLVDITEHRKAEDALRASEERFRALIEEAPDAIVLYDFDGRGFVAVNKAAERLFGAPRDEIIAHGPAHFFAPEQPDGRLAADSVSEHNERALAGEEVTFERRIRRASGEERLCRVTLVRLVADARLVRASLVDITESRRAEEALRKSEEQLRVALQGARAAAWRMNLATGETDWSPEAFALHGRDPESVKPSYAEWLASVHPDDRGAVAAAVSDVLERRLSGIRVEYRVALPSGELRWLAGLSKVEFADDGTPIQVSGINLDITEQKRIECELAAAKVEADRANRAKSKFLAVASHDLRQPVQSLVLQMALVERQIAANPQALETLARMRGSLEGLNGLLTAILDISRLDAGIETRPETVDLGVLLSRLALEYKAKAEGCGLVLRAAPRELWATADPALLERALRNLIENAIRYTPAGGVLIGLRRRGEQVRVDVVDTGIGVPEEKRKDIFEEFVQLGNPGRQLGLGLGLGLAIVERIATLMDATIELNSKKGRGSRFSLTLPAAEAAPAVLDDRAEEAENPGGRVLIVEDDLIVRESLEAMLAQWGYETVTASGGEQAVDIAARNSWRFGCIVTDQRLGASRTGVEAAKEIVRRSGRALPTLVLTGDTAKETIAEIAASGFEVMHKPIGSEPLRRALARMMSA